MAFLILTPNRNASKLVSKLKSMQPDIDIRVWPEVGEPSEIDFVVTWKHPPGELKKYPNLKAISSYGAGVDHLLKDPDLPDHIPITRIVDKKLVHDLKEFVIAVVLNHKRFLDAYKKNQSIKHWAPIPMNPKKTVGILGLGQIGSKIAEGFVHLDFHVCGWDRIPKPIQSVECYQGNEQLDQLLSLVDYLICSLPLTPLTKNILNSTTFNKLKRGAYIINIARGDHLVEEDLLKAIEDGQVSGACLDVFGTEPLPPDHPFWEHPKITITPHIAGITDPESVAVQLFENYQRVQKGVELLNTIDIQLGF